MSGAKLLSILLIGGISLLVLSCGIEIVGIGGRIRNESSNPEVVAQVNRWQATVDRAYDSRMTFSAFKEAHKAELPEPWSHDHHDHQYIVENGYRFNTSGGQEELAITLAVDEHGKILGGSAQQVWHL